MVMSACDMSQYYFLGRIAMRWRKMRPTVTEAAWSVCVSVCVSVGGNLASHKTAKLTEMSVCRANSFHIVTRSLLSFFKMRPTVTQVADAC